MAVAAQAAGAFVPAVVVEDLPHVKAVSESMPAIGIELAGGVRVTIGASAPAAVINATLRALR